MDAWISELWTICRRELFLYRLKIYYENESAQGKAQSQSTVFSKVNNAKLLGSMAFL